MGRAKAKKEIVVIRPNPGPQTEFLSTSADIAIYGGAAGAGKSYALLLDPLRFYSLRGFESVTFRRQSTQITSGGGLWDTSHTLYPYFGAISKMSPRHHWVFPKGPKFAFDHLQYDKSVKAWDGAQLAAVYFDELQHFTEMQFFYMLSRNRTMCGVKPYMRATCNPDPDSFLVDFLDWWIDEEGFPIEERSGKLRYMLRLDGTIHWFDSEAELRAIYPDEKKYRFKTVTFIKATLADNPVLTESDPDYEGNLNAMFEYERKRLLLGNWFARPTAGELFKTFYWKYVEGQDVPIRFKKKVRYWDRAATLPSEQNPDPDWTAGALLGIDKYDKVYVLDVVRQRLEPGDVEVLIKRVAMSDGQDVEIWLEQDPGAAGKAESGYHVRNLIGFNVNVLSKRASKLTYWRPFAAQVKHGNVYLVKGSWNRPFVNELASVTDGTQSGHDDQADAASGAFMQIADMLDSTASAEALNNIGGL